MFLLRYDIHKKYANYKCTLWWLFTKLTHICSHRPHQQTEHYQHIVVSDAFSWWLTRQHTLSRVYKPFQLLIQWDDSPSLAYVSLYWLYFPYSFLRFLKIFWIQFVSVIHISNIFSPLFACLWMSGVFDEQFLF